MPAFDWEPTIKERAPPARRQGMLGAMERKWPVEARVLLATGLGFSLWLLLAAKLVWIL